MGKWEGRASLASSTKIHGSFESNIYEQLGEVFWTNFQILSVLPESLYHGEPCQGGCSEWSLMRTNLVHPFRLCIAFPLLRLKYELSPRIRFQ